MLVVDKGLEILSKDVLPEEKYISIRICGWMQRLWTMQEGWLAPRLYFQFSDGALQGFELWQACMSNPRAPMKLSISNMAEYPNWSPVPRENLIRALVTDSSSILMDAEKKHMLDDAYRQKYPELPTTEDKQLSWLINRCARFDPVLPDAIRGITRIRSAEPSLDYSGEVFTALKGRTTSRLEDEPICIANLLGINSTPIIREKPGERMKLLLRSIQPLPTSIIFSHGARMPEPGYRWAPKTFLVPDSLDYRGSNTACFQDGCLTFELPGAALNLKPALPHDWEIKVDIDDMPFCLSVFESDDAETSWDYYQDVPMMLILRHPMKDRGPLDGVLVSLQKTVDDTLWVLYERPVWISGDFRKPGDRRYGKGIFLPKNQRWCITDTPERVMKNSPGRHILTRL